MVVLNISFSRCGSDKNIGSQIKMEHGHEFLLLKLSEILDCKHHMSRVMRKPTFYICENKDADQLRGNREADQRLCFRHIDSTTPLLSKSEISSI